MKKAFTLVEVLVVLAKIGVVSNDDFIVYWHFDKLANKVMK